MRSLVIGSTSTLGQALGQALTQLGEVRFAGRREADIPFDLSDWQAPAHVSERFDLVVLAAADFGGPGADDLVRAELVNSVGTLAACRLAKHCGARQVILLSSLSALYQPGDRYYGAYSLSKRHAEEVAALFCAQQGLELTVLRLSQVYDSQARCRRHQPLLYAIADNARAGQAQPFYGTLDARRNYLHLDDLGEICTRVAAQHVSGTFTCAHPEDLRLSQIARTAFEVFATPERISFDASKPDLPDLPMANGCETLYQRIGYWPAIDLHTGLTRLKHHQEKHE